MNIEITNYAYDKIRSSELGGIIDKKWEKMYQLLLYNLECEEVNPIFEAAEKALKKPNNLIEIQRAKQALEIEAIDFISPSDTDELLLNSGLLTYAVLGSFKPEPEKYGFPNEKMLDDAITAYCISRSREFDNYIWRHKNFKNTLTNSNHGDCWFFQDNLSHNPRTEQTLFGPVEHYDVYKEEKSGGGFALYYNNWAGLLVSALRLIEHLGMKNEPFVKNWKEFFAKNRGTATAESEWGGSSYDMLIISLFLSHNPPDVDKYKPVLFGDTDNAVISYIKDDFLFIGNKPKEDEKPDTILGPWPVKARIQYDAEDLPKLFEGIMIKYARDRREAVEIMEHFLHGKYDDRIKRFR